MSVILCGLLFVSFLKVALYYLRLDYHYDGPRYPLYHYSMLSTIPEVSLVVLPSADNFGNKLGVHKGFP
jgi:hypothetical protein